MAVVVDLMVEAAEVIEEEAEEDLIGVEEEEVGDLIEEEAEEERVVEADDSAPSLIATVAFPLQEARHHLEAVAYPCRENYPHHEQVQEVHLVLEEEDEVGE